MITQPITLITHGIVALAALAAAARAAHDTCQSRLDALIDWRTKD